MDFKTTNDFLKTSEYLIKALRDKLATEDEFIANFIQISYSPDKISLINYLFDRINNHGLDPSQWIKIYNPDNKLRRRNQNIEHFLPQNPEAELKVKKETLDSINNIGNLLAISYKTNSRLGNASPAKKLERLRGDLSREVQNLVSVNNFISKYSADAASWDKTSIEKRAQDMAKDAYRQIWKIN